MFMSGIAGIAARGRQREVSAMLAKLAHRGPAGRKINEGQGATLGMVWNQAQVPARMEGQGTSVSDQAPSGRLARAAMMDGTLVLERDPLGVAPLYYGHNAGGDLCFASEVKALLPQTATIRELPPGSRLRNGQVEPMARPRSLPLLTADREVVARELRRRLENAVERRVAHGTVGSWLSGGVDSSAMVALARPHVKSMHTFVAGQVGAPDIAAARIAADYLNTVHHELLVDREMLLAALPEVIYHLESFDALLVRSSLTNYLVAREAARYVPAVLSGEASDELFAGYSDLNAVPDEHLSAELLDIMDRLHNTALQRVDRCASAHGILAYVPFSDSTVVEYALRIPTEYKRHAGVEKWILRRALDGSLPDQVLWRKKAKFWEGTGVSDIMADFADQQISDADFRRDARLPNGWLLRTKEELLYYRVFKQHFGILSELSWLGRTKQPAAQS
jgi:asparagine synthase (glutamine-hydrolysing)